MPDSTKRPLKVFLCHASADKPAVRKLYRYLRSKGMDPWLDEFKLLPGQRWQEEIPKALYTSDAIIVLLSKNSITKEGYVQREIKFALDKALDMPEGRIFLIPARIEECEIPESLKSYQWVDLFQKNWNRRLMSSLNERAAQLGPAVEQAIVADDTLERAKIELEVKEKLARENTEREQAKRDADEKASREKKEPEAVEKVELEKAEQETKERLAREKTEREAKEKLAREPRESDAAEKAKREIEVKPVVKKPVVTKPEPKKQLTKKLPLWSIGLIAVAILSLIVWGLSSIPTSPEVTQTFSITQTLFSELATKTSIPTTKTPMPATSTATIIPTPTLGIGSTTISEKDGMTLLYVPAGEFRMGSNTSGQSDEKPEHQVDLDAFWIDQTEVTNALFARCVQDGDCTQPSDLTYYSDSNYANHPVVYVSWNDAYAYCSWGDRRLPTEAEWEKAASWDDGTDEKYVYPWGNDFECTKGNFDDETQVDSYVVPGGENCDGFPRTSPVGSFSTGVSPYGVFDMAGNVWEWVADWYSETYYSDSPSFNPLGPDSGQYRVLRGGSWNLNANNVRSALRFRRDPTSTDDGVGFRCSRSP